MLKIINGKIITPYKIIENGILLIENGLVKYIGKENVDNIKGYHSVVTVDAKGMYVSPGFVDIHSHGGGGHDFMDGTVEAFLEAAKKHASYGTTSMVPTTLTSTNEELKNTFRIYKEAKSKNFDGAEFLGLHLEGPYFSMSQRGAQDPRYIRCPEPKEYEEILSWSDDIIRWSAAPELKGSIDFGRLLCSKKILPAIAHSDATYKEVFEAFENGFTHVTHLYSGTSTVVRKNAFRYAGIVESAYLFDEMTVEIIADGIHLPESLLKLVYKIKGASNIALITDSMRGAGMPDGDSIIGSLKDGQKVIIENGVAKLPDRTAFAGSVATTNRLVSTMVNIADVPLLDAIKMMTETPAKIMNVNDRKGGLVVGKDGDIVIFDDDFDVKCTIIGGVVVYQQQQVDCK